MKPKYKQIRDHLIQGYGISGASAMYRFGVYRLSSVIHRLRNEGLNIKTIITSDGYARYFLIK